MERDKLWLHATRKNGIFEAQKSDRHFSWKSICNGIQVLQLTLNMRKPTVREGWFLSDPLLFVYIFSNNLTFVSEYNCEQYWRQPYSRDANWNTHV